MPCDGAPRVSRSARLELHGLGQYWSNYGTFCDEGGIPDGLVWRGPPGTERKTEMTQKKVELHERSGSGEAGRSHNWSCYFHAAGTR